ncbi:MAG: ABC transporter permease [Candidatus Poribacteria bacterium]|nr:ABC transporter permease [Candidatus Poribacteria bacterium]
MIDLLLSLLAATVRLSIPILLAATGETLVQRSGVINIGIEGMLLTGAFCGMVGAHALREMPGLAPWAGLAFSAVSGMMWAVVFAYFSVARRADQIVVGTAINLTALGLTAFLNRMAYAQVTNVIGFGGGSKLVLYIAAFAFVAVMHAFLTLTHLGLLVRATGEHPRAVDTVGVSVVRLRVVCILIGGAFGGLAGGYLLLTNVPTFIEHMSSGRGFIAIAIVIFGRWNALGVLFAALFFGFADALQVRLEAMGFGIPDEFLKMLPYALTLGVLAGYAGKTRAPSAMGVPYRRE